MREQTHRTETLMNTDIQLFRERLSIDRIKAYATVPKGITGCDLLRFYRQVHSFLAR